MRKFKEKGVTLLELLIVIVLISVMAAILYPNFSSNARKAKRSVALKSVQEVSNRLEKYMTYCNAYTTEFGGNISADSSGDKCTGLGMSVTNTTTLLSDLDVYNINIELDDCVNDKCMTYKITATATGAQQQDSACQSFTLSSTGAKTSIDSSKNISTSQCWS